MSFRARLTLWLLAIAIVPLAILGYGVRREMTTRLDDDAARHVDAVRGAVTSELAGTLAADRLRLQSLATELAADNRFRIALGNEDSPEQALASRLGERIDEARWFRHAAASGFLGPHPQRGAVSQ